MILHVVSGFEILYFCCQAREAAMAEQGKMVDLQRKKGKGMLLWSFWLVFGTVAKFRSLHERSS